MSPDTSRTVLMGKPDAFLVERARAGCDVAFAEIVARYRPSLLRHCSKYLARPRAEDAVQQTFIRAMQWLRTGAEVRELRPWLYAIARNVALNELGKCGWDYDELHEGWEERSGHDEVEHRAAVRETLGAVASLPDRQRRALLRSAVDGISPAAIATELGVSEGAVRQLVHRARVSVRAAVGAVLPAPLAWLARKMSAGAARVAPTSPAAAVVPLAPKLAVVVVAAVTTGVPLAAIVHQVNRHPPNPMVARVFDPVRPSTAPAALLVAPRRGGSGGAGPAGAPAPAGPSFTAPPPSPSATPTTTQPPPPAAAPPGPTATQPSNQPTTDTSNQPASDPGTTTSCDPADPACGAPTGTTASCDPSTDPNCGGTTGTNSGCDPSTDPNCGGTTGTGGTSSGCDPSTDPTCGGTTGTTSGCDPSTDPTCGGSSATSPAPAASSTNSASTQSASSPSTAPASNEATTGSAPAASAGSSDPTAPVSPIGG